MASDALPLASSVPVPRAVAPDLKVTVPVGKGPLMLDTVAVSVTFVPTAAVFGDAESSVVVCVALTVCETTFEVLFRLLVSPPKLAVSGRGEPAGVAVGKATVVVAIPFASVVAAVPITVVPLEKVTVAPAMGAFPVLAVSFAERVTVWVAYDGFGFALSVSTVFCTML